MTILELLKQSLQCYYSNSVEGSYQNPGMCWCIKVTAIVGWTKKEIGNTGHPPYATIKSNIPEFNPGFFGCDPSMTGLDFWWDNRLTEPRIKAFNDLIELYSHDGRKDIPFIWDKKM